MDSLKKTLLWVWLLTKRLFKKPTFVAILLIIPLLTFGFGVLSQEESGFVTIALAHQGEDEISQQIISDLTSNPGMVRFIVCENREEACSLVERNKADGAWIFPDDMEKHIEDFVKSGFEGDGFVTVVEREETVLLSLTREKLSTVMIEYISKENYLQFLRDQHQIFNEMSDQELITYYYNVNTPDAFFVFEYSDSANVVDEDTNSNILLTPLKGLLAIVMLIAGLATSMYFVKDRENGIFYFVPLRSMPFIEFGYQLISAVCLGTVTLVSLMLAGVSGNFLQELLKMLCYVFCVSSFCMLMRSVFRTPVVISVATPFLAVMCLVICPVFFNIVIIKWAQILFPPTYYLTVEYNSMYLLYGLIYAVVVWGIYALSERVRKFR